MLNQKVEERISIIACCEKNKANLRDLIAVTGLVISNWIQIVDS